MSRGGSEFIAFLDEVRRKAILNDELDLAQLNRITSVHEITDLARETFQEVLKDQSAISLYGRAIDTKELLRSVESIG